LLRSKPDGILILANSVDAAMLSQHLRQLDSSIRIAASEWAATEQLIELGGRAVEGIMIAQFLDRQSTQKEYLDFRKNYSERFGKAPGFAGMTAFDATNVVLDAIERQASGQTLKQSLLARKTFPGAQAPVVFDAFGDSLRETFLTTVKDGSFVLLR
jgi:branched-chain amino acid transport system substrate-binding protein